jgi:hypothetical protein
MLWTHWQSRIHSPRSIFKPQLPYLLHVCNQKHVERTLLPRKFKYFLKEAFFQSHYPMILMILLPWRKVFIERQGLTRSNFSWWRHDDITLCWSHVGVTWRVHIVQTSMTDRVRTKCTCPRLWRNTQCQWLLSAGGGGDAGSTWVIMNLWAFGRRRWWPIRVATAGTYEVMQGGSPLRRTWVNLKNASDRITAVESCPACGTDLFSLPKQYKNT